MAERPISSDPVREVFPMEPLVLRPIFTPADIERIKQKWHWESLLEERRQIRLQEEEERVLKLMASTRGAEIISCYDSGARKIQKNGIDSADDSIVLTRHIVETGFHQITTDQREGEDISLREFVLNFSSKNFRLYRHILKQFPSLNEELIAAFPCLDLQIVEFRKKPSGFWQRHTGRGDFIRQLRWFVENEIKLKKENPFVFREALTSLMLKETFEKYGLYQAGERIKYPIRDVLVDAYGELKLKPWEFGKKNWSGDDEAVKIERIREMTRWLVEERLGLNPMDPDFIAKLSQIEQVHFTDCSIRVIRNSGVVSSHIEALQLTYAELDFDADAFLIAAGKRGLWHGESGYSRALPIIRNAVEQLVKCNPDDPDFRDKVRQIKLADFRALVPRGMLFSLFSFSPASAITYAYSELAFERWELGKVPENFWKEKNFFNLKRTLRWVVEIKLSLNPASASFRNDVIRLEKDTFIQYGLQGAFSSTRLNLFELLQMAYPELTITIDEFIKGGPRRKTQYRKLIHEHPLIDPDEADEALEQFVIDSDETYDRTKNSY